MSEIEYYSERFGFYADRGSVHTSRTIMLDELNALLAYVPKPQKDSYLKAITVDNCLGKRSKKTRILTFRHLVELYSLDPETTIFRILLYFRQRDQQGWPLLSFLCAYCRDPLLRACVPFILKYSEGDIIKREVLEEYIDSLVPGRYSKATLKSTAQNINSSMTKTGHISGRSQKIRARAVPTAGSVAYAALLGYLTGARGESVFQTGFMKIMDCIPERAIELAGEASKRGWIIFKRVADVSEVLFPSLLTQQEMEWVREQN